MALDATVHTVHLAGQRVIIHVSLVQDRLASSFASSNHALGFYRCDQKVDHRYPKPDTRYGVSKVFGEMLGSLYADKYV